MNSTLTRTGFRRDHVAVDTGSLSPHGREMTLNAIPAPTDQDVTLAARYLTKQTDGDLFARMLGLDTASDTLEKG
jgi:hypothetical protein